MSHLTHAYCIVRGSNGVVVALQVDDGDVSTLAATLTEFGDDDDQFHVLREHIEDARDLLMKVHPDWKPYRPTP